MRPFDKGQSDLPPSIAPTSALAWAHSADDAVAKRDFETAKIAIAFAFWAADAVAHRSRSTASPCGEEIGDIDPKENAKL